MKTLKGKIVSTKMAKTIVVEVGRQRIHPLYGKIMRRTNRFKVHNEDNSLKIGDYVRIEEIRPLSKEKHFKVTGKVDKT